MLTFLDSNANNVSISIISIIDNGVYNGILCLCHFPVALKEHYVVLEKKFKLRILIFTVWIRSVCLVSLLINISLTKLLFHEQMEQQQQKRIVHMKTGNSIFSSADQMRGPFVS